MGMESLWGFVIIGGPIILGIAIAWGVLTNRRQTRSEVARTEEATRQMYDRQNADDTASEAREAR